MSYRVAGGAKVGGAHRPWGAEASPDKSQPLTKEETEAMRREREACLACNLPDCLMYSMTCPARHYKSVPAKKKGGRKPMEIPEVFVKHGMNGTSNQEWAEHLGVSTTTIQRWRRKLGYQRTSIKTKGR